MVALDTEPAEPGLLHVPGEGGPLAVEVWALAPAAFRRFVAGLSAPMTIGRVLLADGRELPGLLVEPWALVGPPTSPPMEAGPPTGPGRVRPPEARSVSVRP